MRGVAPYVARVAGAGLMLALGGCAGIWFAEREPWRREAEIACLQFGAVKEGPAVTFVQAINGPGVCGADYPLRVAALGGPGLFGIVDEGEPGSNTVPYVTGSSNSPARAQSTSDRAGRVPAAAAAVTPAATLACPLVSRLNRFVSDKVQPAALRWIRQPVAEIKQISAYSCRGMNGDPDVTSMNMSGRPLDCWIGLRAGVVDMSRAPTDGWVCELRSPQGDRQGIAGHLPSQLFSNCCSGTFATRTICLACAGGSPASRAALLRPMGAAVPSIGGRPSVIRLALATRRRRMARSVFVVRPGHGIATISADVVVWAWRGYACGYASRPERAPGTLGTRAGRLAKTFGPQATGAAGL
jgi:hypothetical protein